MGIINNTDFQTPPIVAEYMVSLLSKKCKIVLEPTPGMGNLVRAAQSRGFTVIAPELFEDIKPKSRFDAVVMNPPFTPMIKAFEFVSAVMPMSDHIVSIIPWFTLINSNKRLHFFKDFGLEYIIHLPRKTFPSCRVQCCIIVLNKGYKGPTIFRTYTW